MNGCDENLVRAALTEWGRRTIEIRFRGMTQKQINTYLREIRRNYLYQTYPGVSNYLDVMEGHLVRFTIDGKVNLRWLNPQTREEVRCRVRFFAYQQRTRQ